MYYRKLMQIKGFFLDWGRGKGEKNGNNDTFFCFRCTTERPAVQTPPPEAQYSLHGHPLSCASVEKINYCTYKEIPFLFQLFDLVFKTPANISRPSNPPHFCIHYP